MVRKICIYIFILTAFVSNAQKKPIIEEGDTNRYPTKLIGFNNKKVFKFIDDSSQTFIFLDFNDVQQDAYSLIPHFDSMANSQDTLEFNLSDSNRKLPYNLYGGSIQTIYRRMRWKICAGLDNGTAIVYDAKNKEYVKTITYMIDVEGEMAEEYYYLPDRRQFFYKFILGYNMKLPNNMGDK